MYNARRIIRYHHKIVNKIQNDIAVFFHIMVNPCPCPCSDVLGRYGTFASQSIDYYAHLQALERQVKKLGLRRSLQDMAKVFWYHLAGMGKAFVALAKSPVKHGMVLDVTSSRNASCTAPKAFLAIWPMQILAVNTVAPCVAEDRVRLLVFDFH